jgi:hypothetical protein
VSKYCFASALLYYDPSKIFTALANFSRVTPLLFYKINWVFLILLNYVFHFSSRGLFWSSEKGLFVSSYCMICILDFALYIFIFFFVSIISFCLISSSLFICNYSLIWTSVPLQAVAGCLLLKLPFSTIFEYLQVSI